MDLDELTQGDVDAVAATVVRAAAAHKSGQWEAMVHAAINQDLSWAKPAKKWEAVLEVRGAPAGWPTALEWLDSWRQTTACTITQTILQRHAILINHHTRALCT
jgi:hypothetical protein